MSFYDSMSHKKFIVCWSRTNLMFSWIYEAGAQFLVTVVLVTVEI